ncbi:MAG: hypothetical protein AUH43_14775 [Acidobacteria bacterium 13_1_40CM_65_14]|nr:MAG: hypothetical protein AUH43_14775 [Acidobacteria bacterium 13_1_40CM_65_14]
MKAGREAREEETPIGSEAMAGFAAIGVVEAGRVHETRIVVGDSCTRPVSTMRRRDAARLRTEALRSSDPLCERDQRGLRDLRALEPS